MLQRAASNRGSGHIRTKQSKWLEKSLQDMEEKVQYVLSLIEEDGDSFAKRAEKYYKSRPELISFVEDFYQAFKALAERYDHVSTELQNANNTLGTCFPEQYQLPMDADDENGTTKTPRVLPDIPAPNVPDVLKDSKALPLPEHYKGLVQKLSVELHGKMPSKDDDSRAVAKSCLSKTEAIAEIDRLRKDILGLQTVEECMKSSYQTGLEKYESLENTIMEEQQKICYLQDEFDIDKEIEDDQAQRLMAEAPLKSCQETLTKLQETHQKSVKGAEEEMAKIEDASQRLKHIKCQYLHEQTDAEETMIYENNDSIKTSEVTLCSGIDLDEVIQLKPKQQFDIGSMSSITVSKLGEKIGELVSEVIELQSSVSSQTALLDRLRSESHELREHIHILENDKATLTEGTDDLKKKVKELQDKLNRIHDMNSNAKRSNSKLEARFYEAQSRLDNISDRLSDVKTADEAQSSPDNISDRLSHLKTAEELNAKVSTQDKTRPREESTTQEEKETLAPSKTESTTREMKETSAPSKTESTTQEEKETLAPSKTESTTREIKETSAPSKTESTTQEVKETSALSKTENACPKYSIRQEQNDDLTWQMMLLNGVEDKENFLLKEYSTILKNYKDVRRKLNDMENKRGNDHAEQITELRVAIAKRDEKIQHLHRKLIALQRKFAETTNPNADELSASSPSDDQKIEDITLEGDNYFNFILSDHNTTISPIEEKLQIDINTILDENLDFLFRFSTSFHQIQKFKTSVKDLQREISRIRIKNKQEKNRVTVSIKSEIRPIYKHMKEMETKLKAWLKQSELLKDEIERRFSSLRNVQVKINLALKEGVEGEETKFSSHQAARFQGEILNMKQENNKVSEELKAGVDHITSIQLEVDRTLRKLDDEFELFSANQNSARAPTRFKIQLLALIFGSKLKKQKSNFS